MALLAGGTVVTGWAVLRASLPRTSGHVVVAGMSAPVEVSRDALGIPTIVGASALDIARAQGFVHAQDRYFQMDLTRRYAAGELTGLFGDIAADNDARMRVFQYRLRAGRVLPRLPPRHRRLIDAYVQGINAGLADLGARPPEYLLLRSRPEPWTAQDTVLVLCFFMHSQSISHVLEKPLGVMAATLPPALFEFLTPDTSRFDAPLLPDADAVRLPVPGPDVIDLRGKPPVYPVRDVVRPLGTALPGSNNWAVAGHRTTHGGAILANDPHLLLRVPNVWYRVKLVSPNGTLQGAGPPGIPGVVIGCNDHLAWGVTNSLIDQNDWVVIETDPADPSRYRTPDGWEPFELVDGGAIRVTRWGPVVFEDWSGRPWALR
ncbi:MAG: penicillin acylase family protein, partial [Phycisphaerales bacterium]